MIAALRSMPRTVWLIGAISLVNDSASEMLYPLIPLYLSTVLMATHNQYLVNTYRHRVIEIRRGSIIRDDDEGRYEEELEEAEEMREGQEQAFASAAQKLAASGCPSINTMR